MPNISDGLNARIKLRTDTVANWHNNNPNLMRGEVGIVTSGNDDIAEIAIGVDPAGSKYRESAMMSDFVKSFVKTRTSELTNDSGFITSSTAPVRSVNGKTGVVLSVQAIDIAVTSSTASGDIVDSSFDFANLTKDKTDSCSYFVRFTRNNETILLPLVKIVIDPVVLFATTYFYGSDGLGLKGDGSKSTNYFVYTDNKARVRIYWEEEADFSKLVSVAAQSFTDAEKAQARTNIGATAVHVFDFGNVSSNGENPSLSPFGVDNIETYFNNGEPCYAKFTTEGNTAYPVIIPLVELDTESGLALFCGESRGNMNNITWYSFPYEYMTQNGECSWGTSGETIVVPMTYNSGTVTTEASFTDTLLSIKRGSSVFVSMAMLGVTRLYTFQTYTDSKIRFTCNVGADSTNQAIEWESNNNITLSTFIDVPTTRTINGHALSADITLTAADVGALTLDTLPRYDGNVE